MTRLTSDIFKIGQFFMSIRNYDSTQTNHRKILSSPSVRKSNLKIINFFGRKILNSGSGRKKLSKTHWPKTGVAAPWELNPILRKTLFLDQLPNFSRSSSKSRLDPFLKRTCEKKIQDTKKFHFRNSKADVH